VQAEFVLDCRSPYCCWANTQVKRSVNCSGGLAHQPHDDHERSRAHKPQSKSDSKFRGVNVQLGAIPNKKRGSIPG
jgi:hypothetical protein